MLIKFKNPSIGFGSVIRSASLFKRILPLRKASLLIVDQFCDAAGSGSSMHQQISANMVFGMGLRT